tara:strand:- start:167 stop:601 length:435 start_codon:yes stop_codon:yes gene_type:complete
MGNLDAKRDWGHAKDYVRMQWMMLQQDKPQDFIIASGKQFSVRQFIIWAGEALGIELEFSGSDLKELGTVVSVDKDRAPGVNVGQTIIQVDSKYFRPAEVESLLGDPEKAKKELGWEPEISAKDLCIEMINHDFTLLKDSAIDR